MDIELKVEGLEEIALALVRSHTPRRGVVISSFLPEVLQALHQLDPLVSTGLICETKAELRAWNQLPIQYVIPYHKLIDAELLRELKGARKKVLVWTVNTPVDMKRFAKSGVDGIISDETRLLAQTLG